MEKEQANFRIDADAKHKAYKVLEQMGIKPTDAVNMLMRHIAMFGELPFRPRIPNAETLLAFKESDNSKNLKAYDTVDEMFEDVLNEGDNS